jgi:hypothetical protein
MTRLLALIILIIATIGLPARAQIVVDAEARAKIAAIEARLDAAGIAKLPATQPTTVPMTPPVITPPVVDVPTIQTTQPGTRWAAPPVISASTKVFDNFSKTVNAGEVFDGGGATYKGRIEVYGGTVRNLRYSGHAGTEEKIAVYGGVIEDVEVLDDSSWGVYVGGNNVVVRRVLVHTVSKYPLFIENAGNFLIQDFAIRDEKGDAGSKYESVMRWGNAWGKFHRVYIRAGQGKALSRGDSYLPGTVFDSCDIEGPTITWAPQNPLGEVNGGGGRGRVEFDFSNGTWTARGDNWETCRKAGENAIARGITDRRQIVRESAKVAIGKDGKPCPALSDADVTRTLANRDALIRKTGFASHKNTRIVALDLSPEAGGTAVFEGDCELKFVTLFGQVKATFPRPGWGMSGDPPRPWPSIIIKCPVTTTRGVNTDAATAARILMGTTGKIDGKAAIQ